MAQTETGFPIQNEVGLAKAREYLRGFHEDAVILESLELAAAQLAIGFQAADTGEIETLYDRLGERLADSTNPRFSVEEVLTEQERDFLPAARTIVGLTFQAAKVAARRYRPSRL